MLQHKANLALFSFWCLLCMNSVDIVIMCCVLGAFIINYLTNNTSCLSWENISVREQCLNDGLTRRDKDGARRSSCLLPFLIQMRTQSAAKENQIPQCSDTWECQTQKCLYSKELQWSALHVACINVTKPEYGESYFVVGWNLSFTSGVIAVAVVHSYKSLINLHMKILSKFHRYLFLKLNCIQALQEKQLKMI